MASFSAWLHISWKGVLTADAVAPWASGETLAASSGTSKTILPLCFPAGVVHGSARVQTVLSETGIFLPQSELQHLQAWYCALAQLRARDSKASSLRRSEEDVPKCPEGSGKLVLQTPQPDQARTQFVNDRGPRSLFCSGARSVSLHAFARTALMCSVFQLNCGQ